MIGIIGGAGVAATNKLCELVEIMYTKNGAFRDGHHPEMVIYQATKAPSRSMYLEGRGPNFVSDYVQVGQRLKASGATTLCMCCNTAHYAISELQEKIGLPFLNMVEEVVKAALKSGKTKIGLMASDGCLKGKVYEKYFEQFFPHAQIIYPDDALQKEVTRGICNIKSSSRFLDAEHPDRPLNIFQKVHNQLTSQGAEVVISGCTDIRVDFYHPNAIDSLEILAKLIYNTTSNEK